MQELQINFRSNDDPTLVELSEDDRAKLLKAAGDLASISAYLHELLVKKTLGKGFAETICASVDFYATDIHRILNYDSALVRDKKERYEEIRIANEQNRELRKQLGERVHNDDVRERMKLFCKGLNKWWDDYGCGYISDIQLGEYNLKATAKFNISGIGKEKEEVIASLKKQGVIINEENESVVDCDNNRKWFEDLVEKTFPSGKVFKIHSYGGKKKMLWDAEIVIQNLDDLESIMPATEVVASAGE